MQVERLQFRETGAQRSDEGRAAAGAVGFDPVMRVTVIAEVH